MAEEAKILATIPRTATEQLQISINTYKEKKYLDLRIFYTTDDGGTWLPTKKGVTVSPDNLTTLKDAVEEAMQELLTVEAE
ncbi:MAG: transcriptional coactivator p15/PC4 family protein [Candidatus Gastranaerophilales bacterium]|nr:transcriptional coactivator p15/PC4 family protein [Candidatus Gastranaerophilales bacterium]